MQVEIGNLYSCAWASECPVCRCVALLVLFVVRWYDMRVLCVCSSDGHVSAVPVLSAARHSAAALATETLCIRSVITAPHRARLTVSWLCDLTGYVGK